MVQKVQTKNSKKCINNEYLNKLSYYDSLNGELVLGTYGHIESIDWCLISEINYNKVLESQKVNQIFSDITFIFIVLIILLFSINILQKELINYNFELRKGISKSKLCYKYGLSLILMGIKYSVGDKK